MTEAEKKYLFTTIANGDEYYALEQVKKGIDPNLSYGGQTLLMAAVQKGCFNLSKTLLDEGADPDLSGSNSENPLLLASFNNSTDMILLLLDYGAEVNVRNNFNHTPLCLSCYNGNAKAFYSILEHGADVNERGDLNGSTPLMYATAYTKFAQALLDRGAYIDAQDFYGRTSLWIISHARNHAVRSRAEFKNTARLLLDRGANPNIADNEGKTPLHVSALKDPEMVKILLQYHARTDLKDNFGNLPLQVVLDSEELEADRVAIARELLDYGANPDERDQKGVYFLHKIIRDRKKDWEKLFSVFWEKTKNPDQQNREGETLLMYAIDRRYDEVVNNILKRDICPNVQDTSGWTALIFAIHEKNNDVVSSLLKKGADPCLPDNKKKSPLAYALQERCLNIVKMLLDAGADPEAKDIFGKKPRDYADSDDLEEYDRLRQVYSVPELSYADVMNEEDNKNILIKLRKLGKLYTPLLNETVDTDKKLTDVYLILKKYAMGDRKSISELQRIFLKRRGQIKRGDHSMAPALQRNILQQNIRGREI